MPGKSNAYGPHIEKRGHRFYAVLTVPADVQEQLGRKRYIQALGTDSPAEARRRAPQIVAAWRSQIAKARKDGTDPLAADAAWFRRALSKAAGPEEREAVMDAAASWAEEQADAQDSETEPAPSAPVEEAEALYAQATGTATDTHVEDWLSGVGDEAKAKDQKRQDVLKLAERFPALSQVTRKAVAQFSRELLGAGLARATVARTLSSWRGYWSYLQEREVVSDEVDPFKVKLNGSKKANGGPKRLPFDPADVVRLWKAAEARGDQDLADMIMLAGYTGARLEELSSLTLDRVDLEAGTITIDNAKTPAGNRVIPMHPELKPVLQRRIGNRAKGMLFASFTANKFGDYGKPLSKRFARLRTALGFDSRHVFHSLRKTVATMLQNAGIPEDVSAAILGHKIPTMTYGLYSGGVSLEVKAKAIKKLKYPKASDG